VSPADLAQELELIRCRVAMVVGALTIDNTCTAIDAAKVLQRDVDDALVPIVEELERQAGTSPLQQAVERIKAERAEGDAD
jgi:hypothetical protein